MEREASSWEDSGEMNVERAVAEEYKRFASDTAELGHVSVPTYTYYSRDDASVGMEHAEYWSEHLNVVKARTYDNAGHAVQYRHWGQIMLDMAGYDDYLLISDEKKSMIVPEEEGAALVESGEAVLGIHAWQTGERN
jgi:non-heme chloroperoxidase